MFHQPLGEAAAQELESAYSRLATAACDKRGRLLFNDREIPVRRRAGDLICFDFDALCRGARAAADYIEIAQSFPTVIVSGVPQFGSNDENEARRFVHLVDELYDRGVKLILSAAAPPTDLYRGERLRHEFERTASRLIEMQSQEYLQREHRP